MAIQTTYVSIQAVTLQTREIAYERIRTLMEHLSHGYGGTINLVSIAVDQVTHVVTVVVSDVLPIDQLTHLGLQ